MNDYYYYYFFGEERTNFEDMWIDRSKWLDRNQSPVLFVFFIKSHWEETGSNHAKTDSSSRPLKPIELCFFFKKNFFPTTQLFRWCLWCYCYSVASFFDVLDVKIFHNYKFLWKKQRGRKKKIKGKRSCLELENTLKKSIREKDWKNGKKIKKRSGMCRSL